jgi:hypothetical protein
MGEKQLRAACPPSPGSLGAGGRQVRGEVGPAREAQILLDAENDLGLGALRFHIGKRGEAEPPGRPPRRQLGVQRLVPWLVLLVDHAERPEVGHRAAGGRVGQARVGGQVEAVGDRPTELEQRERDGDDARSLR